MRALATTLLLAAGPAWATPPWEIDYPPEAEAAMDACGRLDARERTRCEVVVYENKSFDVSVAVAGSDVAAEDGLVAAKAVAAQLCRVGPVLLTFSTSPTSHYQWWCDPAKGSLIQSDVARR